MTALSFYRDLLRTNKHRLDDELEQQAELQDQIAQQVNRRQSSADLLTDKLKRVEARLGADAKASYPKDSLDAIAGRVRRDREYIEALDAVRQVQVELREWESLLEAWKVKGFTLRDLGALYGSDYFALTQTSVRAGSKQDMRRMLRDASEQASSVPRRRKVRDAE